MRESADNARKFSAAERNPTRQPDGTRCRRVGGSSYVNSRSSGTGRLTSQNRSSDQPSSLTDGFEKLSQCRIKRTEDLVDALDNSAAVVRCCGSLRSPLLLPPGYLSASLIFAGANQRQKCRAVSRTFLRFESGDSLSKISAKSWCQNGLFAPPPESADRRTCAPSCG